MPSGPSKRVASRPVIGCFEEKRVEAGQVHGQVRTPALPLAAERARSWITIVSFVRGTN